jgi:uncharacterized repeat protein (TIGR02543 family)
MSKKLRFLYSRRALGVALMALMLLAGTCKALVNDEADPDYLMPLPDGVIARFETGRGSYVPYVAGLESDASIPEPQAPVWPDSGVTFDAWFKDNITFSEPWNFATDKIPPNAGKYITLYAKWQSTETERWVPRNYIWENQGNDIMGQVVKLEPGEDYTLYLKCWMQGGSASQINHFVAFYLHPDTGARTYAVRQQISPNNLWTEYSFQFEAGNEWYVIGSFPGLGTSGGGTFYIREMKLTKDGGDNSNLLPRSDFKFGVGLDEDKTYYVQGYLASALTRTGKSDSVLPGVWYYGSSRFSLVRNSAFWAIGDVVSKIAAQGGSVYLDDGERP